MRGKQLNRITSMSVFVGDWVKSRTSCMHSTEPPIINRGSVIVLGCRCFIGAIARTDAASRLLPEELEAMIRAGGFDKFGQTRTRQFWEAQYLHRTFGGGGECDQGWLLPPPEMKAIGSSQNEATKGEDAERAGFTAALLTEPTRRQRL